MIGYGLGSFTKYLHTRKLFCANVATTYFFIVLGSALKAKHRDFADGRDRRRSVNQSLSINILRMPS